MTNDAEKIGSYEAVLKFYADPDSWKTGGDGGKAAREVLAAQAPKTAPGMVKCFSPNSVSWRGTTIEVADDGSCMVPLDALAELRAHSVRPWTEDDEIAADKGDASDPANMGRKELLGFLKGKGAGNIVQFSTEDLRALVVRAIAGEDIAVKTPAEATPPAAEQGAVDEVAEETEEAVIETDATQGEATPPAAEDGGE